MFTREVIGTMSLGLVPTETRRRGDIIVGLMEGGAVE